MIKEYIKKALEKLFYTLISWKNWVFIAVFGISTWLCYIEKIDGSNYTTIISIITPSIYISREFAKKEFKNILNEFK